MQSPGPIAFTIAGFDIRWYGILIAIGMVLAIFISAARAPRHGIDPDDVLDTALIMIPAGIIGARLYYIVFNWSYYAGDLGRMLDIRSGGLAIHGGLIFGLLAVLWLCKKRKVAFLDMTDLFFPTVALAQAIGRWGNFFNGEAHGIETDLPWAILVDGKYVHPTFLYESIWCLVIFIVLSHLYRQKAFRGRITCLYGIMYSAERFLVEGLRTDSLMLAGFRQAQLLSACVLIFCVFLYFYLRARAGHNKRRNKNK